MKQHLEDRSRLKLMGYGQERAKALAINTGKDLDRLIAESRAENAQRVRTLSATTETLAFSMSGLSKIAGLPQMKLGWIVISGPPAERAEARDKLEWIADTYLSVSAPVQQAAPRLLELGKSVQAQIAARVRANLAWLASAIAADSPCRILAVEGGWSATLQVPRIRREEEWALELLDKDNVLVQPGFFYDFESEAFLVLSLLTRRRPSTKAAGACCHMWTGWRCKTEVPMLDNDEFRYARSLKGTGTGDLWERQFRPVLQEYERITGRPEANIINT